MTFSSTTVRQDFPFLGARTGGVQPYVYLDSAATSQKPQQVLDAMNRFYASANAGVHRSVHKLSERATVAYEGARAAVQHFLHARHPEEIVFTKNATEAINLVAHAWARTNIQPGSAIALSLLEHHSNIVPWLQLAEEKDISIEWVDLEKDGTLSLDNLNTLLASGHIKLLALTGLSNVLGVMPPLPDIIASAHEHDAKVLIDAAQLATHAPIDVHALDADFLAFSGHKVYGPTGIGVLYAKRELLEEMHPFLGGGGMIREVTLDHFTPAEIPQRFEAGTPPVAEAVGLNAAIEWITQWPTVEREAHEHSLLAHAIDTLRTVPGLTLLGPAATMTVGTANIHGCVSFTIDGVHPHDLTEILGREGICLRAGHHCTQPLHKHLGISASTRLSVALYSTQEEIDQVAPALTAAITRLKG